MNEQKPEAVASTDQLGPLPEPRCRGTHYPRGAPEPMAAYDADQMRAYAAQQVAAERERLAATPIDYKAAIYHCHETLGHEQGTKGCVAFARGAEWAMSQLKA